MTPKKKKSYRAILEEQHRKNVYTKVYDSNLQKLLGSRGLKALQFSAVKFIKCLKFCFEHF